MAGFRCRKPGCEHLDPYPDLKELAKHQRDYHGVFAGRKKEETWPPPAPLDATGEGPVPGEAAPPGVAPGDALEEAPPEGRRSLRDRFWGAGDRALAPASGRPKPKRVGTQRVWAMVWGWVGLGFQRSGYDPAVGRCMQFQADAAGEILSDVTEGTFLDSIAQPFARSADRLEQAGSLLALPILVGIVERRPDLRPQLEPLLRDAVGMHIVAMVSAARREEERRAHVREAARQLGLDQIPEAADDPESFMLNQIFSDLVVPEDLRGAHDDGERVAS